MVYRILVVEDTSVIRRLIEISLRSAEVEIITRDDGPSGLTASSTEAPDLVILDIGLPGMDGWDVLKAIRATMPQLPVVVLTAHADQQSRVRAEAGGANALVIKPFMPEDLRQVVFGLLMGSGSSNTRDQGRVPGSQVERFAGQR